MDHKHHRDWSEGHMQTPEDQPNTHWDDLLIGILGLIFIAWAVIALLAAL